MAIYCDSDFTEKYETLDESSTKYFGLVLNKSNFYAEQGGQEFDTGIIISEDGESEFVVENVQVFGGYVLHIGFLKYGSLELGNNVICTFDEVFLLIKVTKMANTK